MGRAWDASLLIGNSLPKGAAAHFQAGLAHRGRRPHGEHDRGGLPGRAGLGGIQPSPGASIAALAAAPAAASGGVTTALSGPMVALGDSYTAGALLPTELRARPLGCLRSAKGYPVLVAAALGASLTDVACASAGVTDMTAAQRTSIGANPPQLNALAPDDSLVVLTLTGDDIGFMNVLNECMELSFTDRGAALAVRTTRAAAPTNWPPSSGPRGRGWPPSWRPSPRAPRGRGSWWSATRTFPISGGCWPAVPITDGDVAYLRGIELQLNAMLAAAANAADATFVTRTRPRPATTSASRSGSGTWKACCPAPWPSRSTPTPAARRPSPPPSSPLCGRRQRFAPAAG